jgi:hypothetical protein
MPRLALPFALVGAAAGWLLASFFDNPLLDRVPNQAAPWAALCAAAFGALIGHRLQRRTGADEPYLPAANVALRVAGHVLVGGVACGGLLGALIYANEQGLYSGLLGGLLGGAAFVPVAIVVVSAARRAERARLGSLVARADHRELWSVMLAALAVSTVFALIDWPAGRPPYVALGLVGGALVASLHLLIVDVRALSALRRVARAAERMERRERTLDEGEPLPEVPAVDLGLGVEVRAELVQDGFAYRARAREAALLLGDLDEARAALRRALRVKATALSVAALMLGAHAAASGRRASIAYHQEVCARGSDAGCARVALALARGDDRDRQLGEGLAAYTCNRSLDAQPDGCLAMAEILQQRADKQAEAHSYFVRSCRLRWIPGCPPFPQSEPEE